MSFLEQTLLSVVDSIAGLGGLHLGGVDVVVKFSEEVLGFHRVLAISEWGLLFPLVLLFFMVRAHRN